MTDTFVPPKNPVVGTSKEVTPKVLSAQFGDGYSQRARDGINFTGRSATLTWQGLTHAQARIIEAFFEGKAGADAFLYKLRTDTAALKWKCGKWQKKDDGSSSSIYATFDQVFDL